MRMMNELQMYIEIGWPVFPVHSMVDGKCTCGNEHCSSPGKHPANKDGFKSASTDVQSIQEWFSKSPRNVGVRTGKESGLLVVDIDPRHGGDDEWYALTKEFGKVDTLTVKTGGGGAHYYFKYPEGKDIGCKANIRPGIDIRANNGYVVAPPSVHHSGNTYDFEVEETPALDDMKEMPQWLINVICKPKRKSSHSTFDGVNVNVLAKGQRNEGMFRIGMKLRKAGIPKRMALAAMCEGNTYLCEEPLSDSEIESVTNSCYNYAQQVKLKAPTLSEEAYVGPLGEITEYLSLHSEAPKHSIYLHLLTGISNLIAGKVVSYNGLVEYRPRLFLLVNGRTSIGRKGTAMDVARMVMKEINADWESNCIKAGLSTGEGLITALDDQKSKRNDNRLFIIEPEFASILKHQSRTGNTLSETIRNAYDGHELSTLTKGSPMQVNDYQLDIIGHITPKELRNVVNSVDKSNGFLNRFIFIYSKQSRLLPFQPRVDLSGVRGQFHRLKHNLEKFHSVEKSTELKLTTEAEKRFKRFYTNFYSRMEKSDENSDDDELLARGSTHVWNISMLMAVQNGRTAISLEDLNAAIAIWEFSEQCVYHTFSNKELTYDAQKLYDAIHSSPNGLSRTECSNVFSRKKNKEQLNGLLSILMDNGLVNSHTKGEGAGRTEMYRKAGE